MQLDDMQQESLDIVAKARKAAGSRHNITEAISGMDKLALACLERGDDVRACTILQEKAELQQKADEAAEKAEMLMRLDVKLQEAIKLRQAELFRLQADAGAFRDDKSSVQIKMDKDGKPFFERTAPSYSQPSDPEPSRPAIDSSPKRNYWADPAPTPPSSSYSSSWGTTSQSPRPEPSRFALDDIYAGAAFSLDDLLNESDRRLDAKFLELERQQLERLLRSSGAMGPSAPPPPELTPSAPPPPPPSDVLRFQMQAPVASAPPQEEHKRVMSEWWTMGQNSLMEGALANLKQHHVPQFRDAASAVVAVTNSRVRGQDPSPQQLLSLVVLAVEPPEQHASGAFWGVNQPAGVRRMPNTLKLAIFGAALQYVVEDLLGNHSQILTGDAGLRAKEARAMLVALASVLDLKSAEASDYSVRVICRAIRVSMVNALVPLRRASRESDPALLAQADADLAALHRLLVTLPCALPIATKHVAALEVTEQLRKVATPLDAMRLDSIYACMSNRDSTGTTVRAILGSIAHDR